MVRSCSIGGSKLVAKSLRNAVDSCDPWTIGTSGDPKDSERLGRSDDGCAASGAAWGASGRWFESSRPDQPRPLIFFLSGRRSGASTFPPLRIEDVARGGCRDQRVRVGLQQEPL